MKIKKAMYAGSFDPITKGHVNVIERTAPLYDELFVVIAIDLHKKYMFTLKERVDMIKEVTAHIPNVTVLTSVGVYVVNFAKSLGALTMIRGIRNSKDMEDEFLLAEENRQICPDVETIWVPCLLTLTYVSSTLAKGHVGIDPGWEKEAARLVPRVVVEKLQEKWMMERARKHWANLMNEVGNPKTGEKILEGLIRSYSENGRFYHVLEHIVTMLDEFEEVKPLAKNPIAVKFGIWYHDAVYETHTENHDVISSNEGRSAYRAELDMKKLGLPDELILLVSGDLAHTGLVMATRHIKSVSDLDEQILVDLDLAILGKPEKVFDEYEVNIRKEYAWILEVDFKTGRARILNSLLNSESRPSIYLTDFFRNRYENTARKNLERSIEKLTK